LVQQRACAARDAKPGEDGPFGGELLAGQPLYTHAVAVGLRQAGFQALKLPTATAATRWRLAALGGLPPRPRAREPARAPGFRIRRERQDGRHGGLDRPAVLDDRPVQDSGDRRCGPQAGCQAELPAGGAAVGDDLGNVVDAE
jgi:hypothetical protein